MSTESPHRVLIVGGGFGGLYAARSLRRAPVEVTVVDRANHHLFQPLLYQVAAGILTEGEIAPPLRGLLRRQRNARVVLAEVTDLDLDARAAAATAPDGERLELGYDTLIVAAGARHGYFGHPEWEALAPGLKTLEDAGRVRARVLGAFEMAELSPDPAERRAWLSFAVVGAGPTGVELSGQVADLAHRTLRPDYRAVDTAAARVVLLEAGPDVLATYPESLRRRATRDLERLGVEVRTGVAATGVDPDGVTVSSGGDAGRVEARTVIWAAGVAASPLARLLAAASGAEVDRGGRLAVLPDLTLPGHPEVLAIGDMAALPGVPGIAPAAMQEGRYAARLIRARLGGASAPAQFRYFDKGTMAVIGHNRAVGVSFGVRFAGRPALLVWGLVHVRYLLGWGNRLVTVVRWLWTMLARNRGERVISVGTADLLRRPAPGDGARAPAAGRPAAPAPGRAPDRGGAVVTGAPALLGDLALRAPRVTQGAAAAHAALYRGTQGRVLARWFGASILVLETVGRRSGRRRTAPLAYLADGPDLVVVPANAGADLTPAWWLNLRDAGEGVVVLGRHRARVRPREAAGAERERLWRRMAAVSPLDHYQRQTDRRIPVVVLRPEPGRRAGGVRSAAPTPAGWPRRAAARRHAA